MRRRRGHRLVPAVIVVVLTIGLRVVPLFRPSQPLWLVELPVLIAYAVAGLTGYRLTHGFWPWDRKRRTIERWRWLVERPTDR